MKKTAPFLLPTQVTTLVDLLHWRQQEQPQHRLYTFLEDGETQEQHMTIGQLAQQAQTIGAALQAQMPPGERALLLYPPGLDYVAAFLGCLYAGVIAVPAYPPNPTALERTLPRLQAIIEDAQASVVLTTSPILAMAQLLFMQAPTLQNLHWIATDALHPDLAAAWQPPQITADSLAFLQYTSGSTGLPKGVMLTHHNLMHNLAAIYHCFGNHPQSRGVIWLPPYHDMGLIGGILQPLYGGLFTVLISPLDFLKRPFRWLQAISRYQATCSGGPNFAYDLCVRKVTPEQKETLDLSQWELAFNGAEPIRPQTLARFTAAFAPCGFRPQAFYPCYGLAESTLIAAGGHKTAPPVVRHFQANALQHKQVTASAQADETTRTLIGAGPAIPDQQLRIVDPHTKNRTPAHQVGEIWLAGPSVAQGYWQQAETTQEAFAAYTTDTGEGPFLRTGDLGFLQDGELFVVGRLKDLIIIRGRNHYPQDIEKTVEESHPALRPGCGAAFAIEVDDTEQLIIVQEIDTRHSPDTEAVIQAIREAVARAHELQVHTIALLQPRSIPKTSSGKIQRHACHDQFLQESLDIVASSTLTAPASPAAETPAAAEPSFIQKSLHAIQNPAARQTLLTIYLQEQLAHFLHIPAAQIDTSQSLYAFGLDSLTAIELRNEIETSLGVVLPMADILRGPSIDQVAQDIVAQLENPVSVVPAPTAAAAQTEAPLSYGQRALWYLYQLASDSATYNIARAVRIESAVNTTALHQALRTLVARHPALRTTFAMPALTSYPVQHIHAEMPLDWQTADATTWSEATLNQHLAEAAYTPFDLEKGPLLRVRLYQHSPQQAVLLVAMHHIITDFWSLVLLVNELSQLYLAEIGHTAVSLPSLPYTYADYVQHQLDTIQSQTGDALWAYWQQQLSGVLPTLNLPTDRPRPPVQTNRGASYAFSIEPALTDQIKNLASDEGVTLYMTLLAAFQVLLYRYTDQDDILVGSPTTGRETAHFADLLGYFVNPLVLRARLAPDLTFATFLQQVRQTVLEAFAHQNYPFPLLVERLQLDRSPSHSPLFQVMFVWQKAQGTENIDLTPFALGEADATMHIGPLTLTSVPLAARMAQFDLTLMMVEAGDHLQASMEYNADLFDAATIGRLAHHFHTLLAGIVNHPQQPLARLPLLTAAESHRLLAAWNATQAPYPQDACLPELFEAQVARTPEAIAVVFADKTLTYQALNQRANQLAHYLQQMGVGPDVLVGICMERSLEMVIGLYAILKAGGAYVPLDPTHPPQRILFMMTDAHIPVVLAHEATYAPLAHSATYTVVNVEADWPTIAAYPDHNPVTEITPANLAYTIYTSGSTGKPKGAMNSHGGIVNRLWWMQDAYQLTAADHILQKTPYSFDVSVWEFFWPLLVGARLVVARPGGHMDNAYLVDLINSQRITTLHFVPSMLQIFLEEAAVTSCHTLRQVFCSGEALPVDLLARFFSRLPADIHNLYGPTEAAIDVSYWHCQPEQTKVPIGRPIANTQLYILDQHLQPVPTGVAGELHIGGVGLARGYLQRPGLTAERFIPHPFASSYEGTGASDRLYKTGDLVRYLPDGSIEFLGRLDHQVKVHGFRIELGEIETRLLEHTAVREAVVIVREDQPGHKHLVAYLTISQNGTATPTTSEWRHFLQDKLPHYMIPTHFVILDALPLTSSGKINRRTLPAPQRSRANLSAAFVAPQSQLEQQIAAIWRQTLQIDRVGLHDNFFDLGGHSLLLIQVHRQLQDQLKTAVPLTKLLERPTISTLAHYLNQEQTPVTFESSQARGQKQRTSRRRYRTGTRNGTP